MPHLGRFPLSLADQHGNGQDPLEYQQEAVMIGNVKGMLFTYTRYLNLLPFVYDGLHQHKI